MLKRRSMSSDVGRLCFAMGFDDVEKEENLHFSNFFSDFSLPYSKLFVPLHRAYAL